MIEYVAAGNGPALLAFHGAIGNAESMQWFVRAFSRRFRVIVPSLGERDDVDAFCAGVAAMLDREGVANVIVFGISFGGLVAQSFVRRFPSRVKRLILMSCGVPSPTTAVVFRAASALAAALPLAVVRALVSLFLSRRLVSVKQAGHSVRRALAAQRRRLEAAADDIRPELVAARFRVAADVHRANREIRQALQAWSGSILLMIANDDPLYPARSHRRMRAALPRLRLHVFQRGGHLIPLMHREEMQRIVTEFATGSAS